MERMNESLDQFVLDMIELHAEVVAQELALGQVTALLELDEESADQEVMSEFEHWLKEESQCQ